MGNPDETAKETVKKEISNLFERVEKSLRLLDTASNMVQQIQYSLATVKTDLKMLEIKLDNKGLVTITKQNKTTLPFSSTGRYCTECNQMVIEINGKTYCVGCEEEVIENVEE